MKEWVVLSVLVLLGGFSAAQHVPGTPHQFFGSVSFVNGPAPDGVLVEARIDGVSVADSLTFGGGFGLAPDMFFVTDPFSDRANKSVSFFVDGVDSGVSVFFVNGGSTELDLSVSSYISSTSTTVRRSGGGSGGGGGGSGGGVVSSPKPSCFDGILNCHSGSCETGVDCGGPCDPCMSCSDGVLNQGEEGVDCGGPCPPCQSTTSSSTSLSSTSTTSVSSSVVSSTSTSTSLVVPSAVGRVVGSGGGDSVLVSVGFVVFLFLLVFVYWVLR